MQPIASIIIVSWNRLPLLQRCLPSVVAACRDDVEIVLVDNGSEDGSGPWVNATYPKVRLIRLDRNEGFSRGNNEAIRQTTSPFVLLLNNDVEVEPGWLDPLLSVVASDHRVGAAQPSMMQYEARNTFEYAGAAGGFLDRLGYPFARGRLFETMEEDHDQYAAPRDVSWGSGAALLLRREALDQVGTLDEGFFMHMEEIDLCWRLRRAGWRVRAVPESRVFHIGGGSLPPHDPQKTYYNYRNNLLMLYKNLPPDRFRRILMARLVLDGAAALRAVVSGRFREARAVARAYADGHRMRDRYDPSADPLPRDAPPGYAGSVVWDYFVRRRRTFSALPTDRFRL